MQTKILLAEDDETMRSIIQTILEIGGYMVHAFPNGLMARDAYLHIRPDMVVSDINMPLLDGFGLLDAVRQMPGGEVVPFLFLSARSEREYVTHARVLGADDYLFKPFEPDELLAAVKARLERRRRMELFDTHQAHIQSIIMLANTIEARDPYTRGHVERVQTYAMELAMALGWPPDELVILEYGALLHDIGKVTIPELILNKPARLTPEEFEIIKQHAAAGVKILEGVTHLREALPYILYHHEKWDGTGYPEGLSGENIPRQGRLLAIVDVYDALTSDRPYHTGMSHEKALAIIREGKGKHFDAQMAEVFIKLQEGKFFGGAD